MAVREEIYGKEESAPVWINVNRYLNYLFGITVISFILGAITYGEDFSFYKHAYSHLAMVRTKNGSPNHISMVIVSFSLMLSSIICFRIERHLNGKHNHWLFSLCSIGYLLMLAPCDILNSVHVIGSALVIGSLWFFTVIRLIQLITFTGIFRFIVLQMLLQGTVLPYAYMYVSGFPARHAMQKLALFGLIVVLKIVAVKSVMQEEKQFNEP
ncbi:MAG: hypothetical protein JXR52_05475 [Bacteroidales bacterium]|nr:hypothetical protein [Bacteroidales bacterium]